MTLGANKNIVEGEIADYCMEDNGILVSFSKNPKREREIFTQRKKCYRCVSMSRSLAGRP